MTLAISTHNAQFNLNNTMVAGHNLETTGILKLTVSYSAFHTILTAALCMMSSYLTGGTNDCSSMSSYAEFRHVSLGGASPWVLPGTILQTVYQEHNNMTDKTII